MSACLGLFELGRLVHCLDVVCVGMLAVDAGLRLPCTANSKLLVTILVHLFLLFAILSDEDVVTPLNFRSKALELGFVLKKGQGAFPATLRLVPAPKPREDTSDVPSGRVAAVVRQWPRPESGSTEGDPVPPVSDPVQAVETDTSYALVSEVEAGHKTSQSCCRFFVFCHLNRWGV